MDKEQKPKKKTVEEIVNEAAEKGARKVLSLQRKKQNTNHYRAMEDLLRAYKNTKKWEEHPEDYGWFPVDKSHDISVAPPPGLGLRDKVEMNELFVQSKEASFIRSMARFFELEAVIKLFENRREFIIIRMYYFNEDANGFDRGDDAKRLTWEEIADQLEGIGIQRSVSVLRGWRSKLVREMTVMMFGIDGAISVESGRNNKEVDHEHSEAEVFPVQQEESDVPAQEGNA